MSRTHAAAWPTSFVAIVLLACGGSGAEGVSPSPPAQEWRPLFDGKTTAGWRGYHKQTMPDGWQVVDGALTRVAAAGDIITIDQFDNFELQLEWQISPGGNSGIMYRVSEAGEESYHTGPECQVLDNAGHPDGKNPLTSAGSDYALYAPVRDVTVPVGGWNSVRLIVNGNHVEHWMNDVKLLEYELGSSDWLARVKASKFNEWPQYGKEPKGHIALQDHQSRVAFRNIRIRTLTGK
jgi:3-keto-disaccharide hydrolase